MKTCMLKYSGFSLLPPLQDGLITSVTFNGCSNWWLSYLTLFSLCKHIIYPNVKESTLGQNSDLSSILRLCNLYFHGFDCVFYFFNLEYKMHTDNF